MTETQSELKKDFSDVVKTNTGGVESEIEKKIRQVEEQIEKLEKANEEHKLLIEKEQTLKIERILAGKADAGTPQKEETPQEYAKRVMRNDI